jgi:YbbR domain-containing protein
MLQRIIDWTATDWALKLTALVLAFLLWTTVQADTPGQWTADDIEVRVVNNDADWVTADPPTPRSVRVVFRGPYRELLRAASERPDIIVSVDQVTDSTEVHVLRPNWVRMPTGTPNTAVVDIQPSTVRLSFDRVATRLLPVTVSLQGEPAPGFELVGLPEVEPSVVRASGAGRNLARIDSLRLPPIDLRDRRSLDTLELTIDTTGTGLIISPRTVRVVVPIRPILADTVIAGTRTGAPRPGG